MKATATTLIWLGLVTTQIKAHTLFTTFFINGQNQGDGTCVRMAKDGATATGPIYPINGKVMACGRDGDKPVAFVCPAASGSTLTFEFREWPGSRMQDHDGSIDSGHKGPCAVYLKQVPDMFSTPADGPGWFKIWEDGYDAESKSWCVDRLIASKGLLSVDLPTGIPSGNYLVRPEILALHNAVKGDPQFYTGCAQIFIQDGPSGVLHIPAKFEATIPGYVDAKTPGLDFNIYKTPMPQYTIPGPEVYFPNNPAAEKTARIQDKKGALPPAGAVPETCLLKNANWCGMPIGSYSNEAGCWKGVQDCYSQSKTCWSSAPPSGNFNCDVWDKYCKKMEQSCGSRIFQGPPQFTEKEKLVDMPGEIPVPWNNKFKTVIQAATETTVTGDENKTIVTLTLSSPSQDATAAAASSTSNQNPPPSATPTGVSSPSKDKEDNNDDDDGDDCDDNNDDNDDNDNDNKDDETSNGENTDERDEADETNDEACSEE